METTNTGRINLLGLDLAAMQSFFSDFGEKPFRAGQVMQWIHHYGATDFDAMTNLSKALRTRLQEIATIRPPEVELDGLAGHETGDRRQDGRGRRDDVVDGDDGLLGDEPDIVGEILVGVERRAVDVGLAGFAQPTVAGAQAEALEPELPEDR